MKLVTICIIILSCSWQLSAQNVTFKKSDQKIRVVKGDVISIKADTAYIVSAARAGELNEKLNEFTKAAALNHELKNINGELLSRIREVEKLMNKLVKQMEQDGNATSVTMDDILKQLDQGLIRMKANNQNLEDNNQLLEGQINELNHTIKKLRKSIRGIWWNGVTDKLVAGGVGVVVGIVLMAL